MEIDFYLQSNQQSVPFFLEETSSARFVQFQRELYKRITVA